MCEITAFPRTLFVLSVSISSASPASAWTRTISANVHCPALPTPSPGIYLRPLSHPALPSCFDPCPQTDTRVPDGVCCSFPPAPAPPSSFPPPPPCSAFRPKYESSVRPGTVGGAGPADPLRLGGCFIPVKWARRRGRKEGE